MRESESIIMQIDIVDSLIHFIKAIPHRKECQIPPSVI